MPHCHFYSCSSNFYPVKHSNELCSVSLVKSLYKFNLDFYVNHKINKLSILFSLWKCAFLASLVKSLPFSPCHRLWVAALFRKMTSFSGVCGEVAGDTKSHCRALRFCWFSFVSWKKNPTNLTVSFKVQLTGSKLNNSKTLWIFLLST